MAQEVGPEPGNGGKQRSRLVGTVLAVAVAVGVVSWVAGQYLNRPIEIVAPPASAITVPVEFVPLEATIELTATLRSSEVASLDIDPARFESPVITATPVRPGQALVEGDVALEVSGRPVFLFEGAEPASRDLEPQIEGTDVSQLEHALQRLDLDPGQVDGTYDSATAAAVRALYENSGYKPPGSNSDATDRLAEAERELTEAARALAEATASASDSDGDGDGDELQGNVDAARTAVTEAQLLVGTSLPLTELLFVDDLPAVVKGVQLRVGDRVDGPTAENAPVTALTVARRSTTVEATVDESTRRSLDVNMSGYLVDGQGRVGVPLTIDRISALLDSDPDNPVFQITLSAADPLPDDLPEDPLTVRVITSATDGPTAVVPRAAVVGNSSGASFVDLQPSGTGEPVRVEVAVTVETPDAVAVSPIDGSTIEPGDRVVVGHDLDLPDG